MTSRSRTRLAGLPALLVLLAAAPASAQFKEAAQASGLRVLGSTWGAGMADLDGDGDLEILAGRHFALPVIFWNLGGGIFEPNFHPAPFTGPVDRHGALILPLDGESPDLVFTHGAGGGASTEANELYLNDGAGTLTPLAGAAGLDDPAARARCVSAADFDGDGLTDLWIGGAPRVSDPNALFRNGGALTFTDVAAATGLDEGDGTVGGLWGDFDDDGDPDLFVGGEEFARPSVLWRNDGGVFSDASGMFSPAVPVVSGADCGDYDNDGDLDLAVCDGTLGLFDTFAEGDTVSFYFNTRYAENGVDGLTVPSSADTVIARLRYRTTYDPSRVFLGPSGVHPFSAFQVQLTDAYVGAPAFTPGVDTGIFVWRTAPGGDWEIRCSTPDVNFDVFDGLFVDGGIISGVVGVDLEDSGFVPGGPRVWRNDGTAFTEVSGALGLPAAMLNPRDISWVDYDNDGDLDLHVVDMGTSADPNAPDALFRNDGAAFTDVTTAEKLTGGTKGLGDGGVWGDVDDDGDLDLFLEEGAGPLSFYLIVPTAFHRNDGERGAAFRLDLTGTASGAAAVGARVTVAAGPVTAHRRVAANSWRGFQDPLRVHVGVGAADRADSLTVAWPSGVTRTYLNPFPARYAVREDVAPAAVDLAIGCAVSDPLPAPGDTVTVTVTALHASGPGADAAVTSPVPAGLTFVSAAATAGAYDPASGVWEIGLLAAAAAESLAITVAVDAGAGGLSPVCVARLSALALERPDTLTANDADSATIVVQAALAVSSAADQSFPQGTALAPAAPVTVTDDAAAPGITAAADIRIRIPAGFPMTWDVSVGALTVTGPAAAKVAGAVTYEDGGRILVLDVTADFAPNDRVTVSGAGFADLSAPASGRLELEIDAAGTLAALDDKTITVFGPTAAGELPPASSFGFVSVAPNPWKARTTIRFAVPSTAGVRLGVYDVAGRKVRDLLRTSLTAGRHEVVWDGGNGTGERVAPGVYFLRLEASGQVSTRSLVLIR